MVGRWTLSAQHRATNSARLPTNGRGDEALRNDQPQITKKEDKTPRAFQRSDNERGGRGRATWL